MKPKAPSLWVKLRLSEGGELGPGKIALLKNVREHKSIAAAARAMGMSYRRAWLLIDEIGKVCGAPVVETFAGGKARGGASLTPLAEQLIELFDRVVDDARKGAADSLRALEQALPRAFSSEVDTGSREENATKQELRVVPRFEEERKRSKSPVDRSSRS